MQLLYGSGYPDIRISGYHKTSFLTYLVSYGGLVSSYDNPYIVSKIISRFPTNAEASSRILLNLKACFVNLFFKTCVV
jgi:hypothetical protein